MQYLRITRDLFAKSFLGFKGSLLCLIPLFLMSNQSFAKFSFVPTGANSVPLLCDDYELVELDTLSAMIQDAKFNGISDRMTDLLTTLGFATFEDLKKFSRVWNRPRYTNLQLGEAQYLSKNTVTRYMDHRRFFFSAFSGPFSFLANGNYNEICDSYEQPVTLAKISEEIETCIANNHISSEMNLLLKALELNFEQLQMFSKAWRDPKFTNLPVGVVPETLSRGTFDRYKKAVLNNTPYTSSASSSSASASSFAVNLFGFEEKNHLNLLMNKREQKPMTLKAMSQMIQSSQPNNISIEMKHLLNALEFSTLEELKRFSRVWNKEMYTKLDGAGLAETLSQGTLTRYKNHLETIKKTKILGPFAFEPNGIFFELCDCNGQPVTLAEISKLIDGQYSVNLSQILKDLELNFEELLSLSKVWTDPQYTNLPFGIVPETLSEGTFNRYKEGMLALAKTSHKTPLNRFHFKSNGTYMELIDRKNGNPVGLGRISLMILNAPTSPEMAQLLKALDLTLEQLNAFAKVWQEKRFTGLNDKAQTLSQGTLRRFKAQGIQNEIFNHPVRKDHEGKETNILQLLGSFLDKRSLSSFMLSQKSFYSANKIPLQERRVQLKKNLFSENEGTCLAAAYQFRTVKDATREELLQLVKLAIKYEKREMRDVAQFSLARINPTDDETHRSIAKFLEDKDPELKLRAVILLKEIARPAANDTYSQEMLVSTLKSEDNDLRKNAEKALLAIKPSHPTVLLKLIELFETGLYNPIYSACNVLENADLTDSKVRDALNRYLKNENAAGRARTLLNKPTASASASR